MIRRIIKKLVKKEREALEGVADNNIWFNDIEVFPNYSLFIFENKDTYEQVIIEIHDKDNGDLAQFLGTKINGKSIKIIGYNCIHYDGQVMEFVIKNPRCSVGDIKEFNDKIIKSKEKYPPYKKLTYQYLDLMEINNFGPFSAKSTSLKQLAFFYRDKSIRDSPLGFEEMVKDSDKEEIVKYCLKDIEDTRKTYNYAIDIIILRMDLGEVENLDFINDSEVTLAKKYFINTVSKLTGESPQEIKAKKTYRDKVVVKDIILPYIKFNSSEFNKIKEFYEGITLYPTITSKINPNKKCISLQKAIEKVVTIRDTEYVYAGGGLHGCYKSGVYKSTEDTIILDIDYESFYPRLASINRFSPAHIDTDIYVQVLDTLFGNRKKYNKKDHFALNYAYKIILNLIYGQSNTEFGPFYDAEYTLKTCVNGMLTISMLVENFLMKIPDLVVLQANTDGVTVMFKRDKLSTVEDLIRINESITGLKTETVEYKEMIINDVNNYMSIDINGDIKQKGCFLTRDVMLKAHSFEKDPSKNIVAIALGKYFSKGIPVEDTINSCNNIHEFMIAGKKDKKFKWLLNTVDTNGVVNSKFLEDRVVRYYVGGKSSITKMWLKGQVLENGEKEPSGFTLLNASKPVTLAQVITNEDIIVFKGTKDNKVEINNYPDLDRDFYINECKKIILNVEKKCK